MLGAVVEKVSGMSLDEFFRRYGNPPSQTKTLGRYRDVLTKPTMRSSTDKAHVPKKKTPPLGRGPEYMNEKDRQLAHCDLPLWKFQWRHVRFFLARLVTAVAEADEIGIRARRIVDDPRYHGLTDFKVIRV